MQFKQQFTIPFKKELNVQGIYLIEIGTHSYIGSSKNIKDRLATHRKNLRAGKGINNKMQYIYDKHKEYEMYGSLLEEVSDYEQLLIREEY